MAEEKKIIIDVETKVDNKGLDNVDKSLENISENSSKAKKGLSDMSDGAKKLTASFKDIAKTLGFVELLKTLKDVFMQNQKVADLFATAMGTVNIVFNQVVDAVTKVVENVAKATNNFEGLTNVLKGSFGVALNAIKLTFYDLKIAVQAIQLAWEKSIFGKGDPAKIKELQDGIDETKNKIIEAGEGIIKNGKLVVDNVGKAIDEVGKVAEGTADAISKIDPSKALDKSKQQVAALKAAKVATAQLSGTVAEYERQEEKLRQTRDDITLSIEERSKASKELSVVIEKDKKAQLELVALQVKVAQLNYDINKSDENRVALIEAKNKVKEVEAQIEGKVTEQKMAGIAVTKEGEDLDKSIIKAKEDRTIKQKEFNASIIEDDLQRLEAQKANLQDLSNTELVTLKNNIDRYKEGTQARADAEKEYADRKQEIDNQIVTTDKAIADKKKEIAANAVKAQIEAGNNEIQVLKDKENQIKGLILSEKIDTLNQINQITNDNLVKQRDLELKNTKLTQEERANIIAKYNQQVKQNNVDTNKAILDARYQTSQQELELAANVTNSIASLSDALFNIHRNNLQKGSEEEKKAAEKQFKVNKALQLAVATVTGIQTVMAAFQNGMKNPVPLLGPATATVYAVAAGIAAAANIAKIASTQFDGSSFSSSSAPATSIPTPSIPTPSAGAPSAGASMNLGQNQLQLKEGALKYMKVYVTETDIKSATSRVDVIENRSKIR